MKRFMAIASLCVMFTLWFLLPVFADNFEFQMIEPIKSETLQFSDETISIDFSFPKEDFGQHKRISFLLSNRTDQAISIIWDACSITLPSGQTSQVIHEGIRYMHKQEPMAPTTVPPGASIQESVIPTVNIYYSDGWIVSSLELRNGSIIGLYLNLKIAEETRSYFFRFYVRKPRVKQPRSNLEPGIHVVGLSFPTIGTVEYDTAGRIVATGGLNYFLGASYRRYLGSLHSGLNFFVGGGTLILIIPYWEFGLAYAIPLGYRQFLTIDLYFLYIIPLVGISFVF